MSYVPVSIDVFTSAFAGAIAGTTGGRNNLSKVPTDYLSINNTAGAFAQAFDTALAVTFPNTLQLKEIQSLVEEYWYDRSPDSVTPADYNSICLGLIALLTQSGIYFA